MLAKDSLNYPEKMTAFQRLHGLPWISFQGLCAGDCFALQSNFETSLGHHSPALHTELRMSSVQQRFSLLLVRETEVTEIRTARARPYSNSDYASSGRWPFLISNVPSHVGGRWHPSIGATRDTSVWSLWTAEAVLSIDLTAQEETALLPAGEKSEGK